MLTAGGVSEGGASPARLIDRTFVTANPKFVARRAWQKGTLMHPRRRTSKKPSRKRGILRRTVISLEGYGICLTPSCWSAFFVKVRPWDLRRTAKDFLWSAGGVLVLLALLVAFDTRVRDEATSLSQGMRATAQIAAAEGNAHSLVAVLVASARQQSRLHAPMMLFVFA